MDTTTNLQELTINEIAGVISMDWKPVWFGAVPYLNAMRDLESIHDWYGLDSGETIVSYFLSNAATWRGPIARQVKAELKRRLKNA